MDKYNKLSRLISIYSSSLDKTQVLGELIGVLEEEYGEVDFCLKENITIMSDMPVKTCLHLPELGDKGYGTVGEGFWFPLQSSDEVYGFIMVGRELLEEDITFIKMATDFVGKALEPVFVKQSMTKLINDLGDVIRVVYELTEKESLSDMTSYMVTMISDRIDVSSVGVYFNYEGKYVLNEGSYNWDMEYRDVRDPMGRVSNTLSSEKIRLDCGSELLVAPLIKERDVIGFVFIKKEENRQFVPDDLRLFDALIYYASSAFYSALVVEELKQKANLDELTGLFNRHYIEKKVAHSLMTDGRGSFLIVDIDDFKSVNDELGHTVGDRILGQVAKIIMSTVREGDLVARWGGEEIVIYLPRMGRLESRSIVRRVVENVSLETDPAVTISCGVAVWEGNMDYGKLFERADNAMYRAKNSGKNKAVIDTGGIQEYVVNGRIKEI